MPLVSIRESTQMTNIFTKFFIKFIKLLQMLGCFSICLFTSLVNLVVLNVL